LIYYPAFEQFKQMTKEGNLIPIYREILADIETPFLALIKLRAKPYLFLLESMEGSEKWDGTPSWEQSRIISSPSGDELPDPGTVGDPYPQSQR
jgi:anthranilate synthase component 1